jgi:hypothetical protein
MQLKKGHRMGSDWWCMKSTQSSGASPFHPTVAGESEFKAGAKQSRSSSGSNGFLPMREVPPSGAGCGPWTGVSAGKATIKLAVPPRERAWWYRLKIARGPAAKDFDGGQGGEVGASPPWAVTTEPTPASGKRPAARRVFAHSTAGRCSFLGQRALRPSSLVAPGPAAHCAKTGPTEFSDGLSGRGPIQCPPDMTH